MRVYTIGFTGKTAAEFFESLRGADAQYLLDVRLRNNSQLAGFTKKGNIEYFTQELTDLEYMDLPILAPEEEMFKEYRKDRDWPLYEARYLRLLHDRHVEAEIDAAMFEDGGVLLCSEPTPEMCHRRLAAEYLQGELLLGAEILHL